MGINIICVDVLNIILSFLFNGFIIENEILNLLSVNKQFRSYIVDLEKELCEVLVFNIINNNIYSENKTIINFFKKLVKNHNYLSVPLVFDNKNTILVSYLLNNKKINLSENISAKNLLLKKYKIDSYFTYDVELDFCSNYILSLYSSINNPILFEKLLKYDDLKNKIDDKLFLIDANIDCLKLMFRYFGDYLLEIKILRYYIKNKNYEAVSLLLSNKNFNVDIYDIIRYCKDENILKIIFNKIKFTNSEIYNLFLFVCKDEIYIIIEYMLSCNKFNIDLASIGNELLIIEDDDICYEVIDILVKYAKNDIIFKWINILIETNKEVAESLCELIKHRNIEDEIFILVKYDNMLVFNLFLEKEIIIPNYKLVYLACVYKAKNIFNTLLEYVDALVNDLDNICLKETLKTKNNMFTIKLLDCDEIDNLNFNDNQVLKWLVKNLNSKNGKVVKIVKKLSIKLIESNKICAMDLDGVLYKTAIELKFDDLKEVILKNEKS